jgi:hypothetical protein
LEGLREEVERWQTDIEDMPEEERPVDELWRQEDGESRREKGAVAAGAIERGIDISRSLGSVNRQRQQAAGQLAAAAAAAAERSDSERRLLLSLSAYPQRGAVSTTSSGITVVGRSGGSAMPPLSSAAVSAPRRAMPPLSISLTTATSRGPHCASNSPAVTKKSGMVLELVDMSGGDEGGKALYCSSAQAQP